MPCRALEAFRLAQMADEARATVIRLNALSGIGGVQTTGQAGCPQAAGRGLNALSGIGGVQTDYYHHETYDLLSWES